jgi:hypothetical protein
VCVVVPSALITVVSVRTSSIAPSPSVSVCVTFERPLALVVVTDRFHSVPLPAAQDTVSVLEPFGFRTTRLVHT